MPGYIGDGGSGVGPRSIALQFLDTQTPGSGSFTAPKTGWYTFFLWGGGAGVPNPGGFRGGGGGGAAGRKTLFLEAGQVVSYSIAAAVSSTAVVDGNNSTITLPDSTVLTAGGGKVGRTDNTRALGGVCSGAWDATRNGGYGGASNAAGWPTAGEAGGAGDFGGAGGNGGAVTGGNASGGGGGGGAGFSDLLSSMSGGNGVTAGATGASTMVAAGLGAESGGTSGAGRLMITGGIQG